MEALNTARKRLQRARNQLKTFSKLESIISGYSDVSNTLGLLGSNTNDAVVSFESWANDASSALEEYASDVVRIAGEESEALDMLVEQYEVFTKALKDIRQKQEDYDMLAKQHRDAQAAVSKAYKRHEKAKTQKKYEARKAGLEADVEAATAEMNGLHQSLIRMKLVVKRFEHQVIRTASEAINNARIAYHTEMLQLAYERTESIARIPDVVGIVDGIVKYSTDADESAGSSGTPAPAPTVAAGTPMSSGRKARRLPAMPRSKTVGATPSPSSSSSVPPMKRTIPKPPGAEPEKPRDGNALVDKPPNSFDDMFRIVCLAGGMGIESCGVIHEFALNFGRSSRIKVDCQCMSLIAVDVRDANGSLFLGSGFRVLEGDDVDVLGIADASVVRHPGPWPVAEFLDDPWDDLWNEPTTERPERDARRGDGPKRMMASAIPGKKRNPRRADQLPIVADARYIIAEDCDSKWWYGMQIGGDFGFIPKAFVTIEEDPTASS